MKRIAVPFALGILLCHSAAAAPVSAFATGFDLIGGTVTVTYGSGAVTGTDIDYDMVLGTGFAFLPGFFHFSVGGDTSSNPWRLVNVNPTLTIVSVTIDLSGSQSVFDDDSIPSSDGSSGGLFGAFHTAGTPITSALESVAWTHPENAGDLYLVETLTFAGIGPAGASSEWFDDTDVKTPEPGTWVLCAAALALLRARRIA